LFVKTPSFLQKIFPSLTWKNKTREKKIWLTFDDGPEEEVTEFILLTLKKLEIRATFFLTGEQIKKYPELTKQIIEAGHIVGNHSFSHLDGFKTKKEKYIYDIELCQKLINEKLVELGMSKKLRIFRPPYGRILPKQIKLLKEEYQLVMWDVFSWDFKKNITKEKLYKNVLENVESGSIIVFHNNQKSYKNLLISLESILVKLKSQGYSFSTTW